MLFELLTFLGYIKCKFEFISQFKRDLISYIIGITKKNKLVPKMSLIQYQLKYYNKPNVVN